MDGESPGALHGVPRQHAPLPQITPSKTDEDRLLLVSPGLADVLSAIIQRVHGADGKVPFLVAHDHGERVWHPPMPVLFQRHHGVQGRPVSVTVTVTTVPKALDETMEAAGLSDNTGQPLRYQPRDFREIFVTDAIMSGLPPHLAQVVVGQGQPGSCPGAATWRPASRSGGSDTATDWRRRPRTQRRARRSSALAGSAEAATKR